MIDMHTHILPGIDDGSRNSQMSIEMLKCLKEEGVTDVVLSPHFYASQNSVEEFLARRQVGIEHLESALEGQSLGLRLHPAAEVLFMDSLDKVDGLGEMTIGGTKYLLLEMPFKKWGGRELDTVYNILCSGFKPIIAHFERYIEFNGGMREIYELKNMGCILQMNAENFKGFFQKRRSVKFFDERLAALLGSDCHNLDRRPPKIRFAYEAIEKKLGTEAVEKIINLGSTVLDNSKYIQA